MKYKLQSSFTMSAVYFVAFLAGIVASVYTKVFDYEEMFWQILICTIVVTPFFLIETIRAFTNVLFFDDNSFTVKNQTYSYKQIKSVRTAMVKKKMVFYIYVGDKCVYRFNEKYKNTDLFYSVLKSRKVVFKSLCKE